MTTTVSLAARDFIVVGCDSLATFSKPLVDPEKLQATFFDSTGVLKLDADGKPLLQNASQMWQTADNFPVNQLPSVTKIFDLLPKKAAVLFAGAARIKDLTVKNLVESFKESSDFQESSTYTMASLAGKLKDFIVNAYESQFPNAWERPLIEIILSGYSTGERFPEVFRITCNFNWQTNAFNAEITEEVKPGNYDIIFGGQYDVIQRVVNGIDIASWASLKERCLEILRNYRSEVQNEITKSGIKFAIPNLDESEARFDLFDRNFGGVSGIFSDVGSLSEQAGIDFVTFLVETMIKSQEFSSSIPTVGGDIHVGLITASQGFHWISKEEYKFEDYTTPKFNHHA